MISTSTTSSVLPAPMHFGPHDSDEELLRGIRTAIGLKEDPHYRAGCAAMLWAGSVVPLTLALCMKYSESVEVPKFVSLIVVIFAFYFVLFLGPALLASPFAWIATMLRPPRNADAFWETYRFAVLVGAIRIHLLLTCAAVPIYFAMVIFPICAILVFTLYCLGLGILQACWRLLFG